jgi:hypothetical protein
MAALQPHDHPSARPPVQHKRHKMDHADLAKEREFYR